MDTETLNQIIQAQKAFYETGQTRNIKFRKQQLRKLRENILKNENELYQALWKDLHKSPTEVWITEIGLVLQEIRHMIRNLDYYSRNRRVGAPLLLFRAGGRIVPEPYGQVLIISPWNYPFQLLFNPLVGAIAAGNCAIIRPSSNVPHTNKVMSGIIRDSFPREYISSR